MSRLNNQRKCRLKKPKNEVYFGSDVLSPGPFPLHRATWNNVVLYSVQGSDATHIGFFPHINTFAHLNKGESCVTFSDIHCCKEGLFCSVDPDVKIRDFLLCFDI